MTSEFDREQELRRLLADAVEPVEPAPGAQARLLARARAQRNRRPWHQRPLMTRWVPGVLATLLVIAGVTVVVATHHGDGSGASSAGSAAAGAPSRVALPSSAAAEGTGTRTSPVAPASPQKGLSQDTSVGQSTYGALNPNVPVPAALRPSDLDGDGRPDTFTIGAGTLAAQLTRYGLEAVSLPPLGPGARVLGMSSLTDQNGSLVAVVFVRLRQAGSTSTDTIASLVDGHLTVLKQGSGPVLLTTDAHHGYACNQGTLVESGSATPFVLDGAKLITSPSVRGAAAAAPAKTVGCG